MKRTLSAAFSVASIVISCSLPAVAAPNMPELVVDVGTGQVIYADEATRPWYPASTTKMMTAYVALRAVKAGLIRLDTPLVASSRAAGQPPSKLGIRPGQEITLDNALKILMVKSANDLAVVVAEGIGGSIPGFAQMMNNEARRLGMTQSRFVNPHGFHNPNHVTSARDLAILARTMLFEFPEYRGYWGIGAVRLGNKVMKNTNGLIGRYPGVEGFKTGFVCASGFNLVATATQGGRQVLAIVLGATSGADRTIRAAGLLDKGFSSWGGGYGALTGLAGSGYSHAPDMRSAICSGRRMRFLTEEDNGSALMGSSPTGDNSSVYAVGGGAPSSRASGSGGGRALGPRGELAAIQVYLGRAAGSTEVARGAGNGAVNGVRNTAAAFAAEGQPGSARTAARPTPVNDENEDAAPASRQARPLPGAITAAGPGAIGLRRASAEPAPRAGAISTGNKGMDAARAAARPGAIEPQAATPVKSARRSEPSADKSRAGKPGQKNAAKSATAKTATAKAATAKTGATKSTPKAAAAKATATKAGTAKATVKDAAKTAGKKAVAKAAKSAD